MGIENKKEIITTTEIGVSERLSLCACKNLSINTTEYYRRLQVGLVTQDKLNPNNQITRYLDSVKTISPDIDLLADNLISAKNLPTGQELIITIPAVGFGDQEQNDLVQTLLLLSRDKLIINKKAAIIVLVNRPEGYQPDNTSEQAQKLVEKLGINCLILEQEIPFSLGNIDGSFKDEMALSENEVPIGLIRDILNIVSMKLWLKSGSNPSWPPILLQMDADFTGFKQGELSIIVNYFDAYKDLQFLQCTSDWENPQKPVRNNYPLWVGTELMRELPQIIKRNLRTQTSQSLALQLIFGEAIQRGIQVPQAERMEAFAKKGGFGLNRLKEDELDTNIRMTAISSGLNSVGATDRIVFNWSARRAEKSWTNNRMPAISQWATPFLANDPVRIEPTKVDIAAPTDTLQAISKTLERLPYPSSILKIEPYFFDKIFGFLQQYRPDLKSEDVITRDTGTGTFILELKGDGNDKS